MKDREIVQGTWYRSIKALNKTWKTMIRGERREWHRYQEWRKAKGLEVEKRP